MTTDAHQPGIGCLIEGFLRRPADAGAGSTRNVCVNSQVLARYGHVPQVMEVQAWGSMPSPGTAQDMTLEKGVPKNAERIRGRHAAITDNLAAIGISRILPWCNYLRCSTL